MRRTQAGILAAAFLISGCGHHQPVTPAQNEAGIAAVAQNDSELTGVPVAKPATGKNPYPRATFVAPPPKTSAPTASAPALLATATPTPAAPAPLNAAPSTPPDSTPMPLLETPDTNAPAVTPPPPPTPPAPRPMDEDEAKKQVVVLETSLGHIVIELDDVSAPRTCGNFRKLVSDGFYNHTLFHRVIPHFMIQGGDPNSKGDNRATYGQGDPGYTLPAEIKLKHIAGAVAMARLPDTANPQRESNGSQFYICAEDCPSLDGQYTVFGHVIAGMSTVNRIAQQQRDPNDDPVQRIEIQATLEPKRQALEENQDHSQP